MKALTQITIYQKILIIHLLLVSTLAQAQLKLLPELSSILYEPKQELPVLADLRLNYHSGRNYIGFFGYGWCSLLDWKFHKLSDKIYEIDQCGLEIKVSNLIAEELITQLRPFQRKNIQFYINTQYVKSLSINGQKLQFHRDKNSNLKAIQSNQTVINFNYDDLDNLTLISRQILSDLSAETEILHQMTYKKDLITETKDAKGCKKQLIHDLKDLSETEPGQISILNNSLCFLDLKDSVPWILVTLSSSGTILSAKAYLDNPMEVL